MCDQTCANCATTTLDAPPSLVDQLDAICTQPARSSKILECRWAHFCATAIAVKEGESAYKKLSLLFASATPAARIAAVLTPFYLATPEGAARWDSPRMARVHAERWLTDEIRKHRRGRCILCTNR